MFGPAEFYHEHRFTASVGSFARPTLSGDEEFICENISGFTIR
jgi:hypothetical protein